MALNPSNSSNLEQLALNGLPSSPRAVKLSCLNNAYIYSRYFKGILTRICQTDLVFSLIKSSLVGLCARLQSTLRVAVTICSTLVNIQTDCILISLYV